MFLLLPGTVLLSFPARFLLGGVGGDGASAVEWSLGEMALEYSECSLEPSEEVSPGEMTRFFRGGYGTVVGTRCD